MRTIPGSDGLVHSVYIAPKLRQFQSDNWLLCTRENLYSLQPHPADTVVTCLHCLVMLPPVRDDRW